MKGDAAVDGKVKQAGFLYLIAGIAFALVLSGTMVLKKYGDALSNTFAALQRVKGNLVRAREAVPGMQGAIADIKKIVPSDIGSRKPEDMIFASLDEIKSRLKDAEITITDIEYKGDEVDLPVTIKSTMRDYTGFVNTIGYLQSLRFPFFSISGLSMTQTQEKERTAVTCEIKGALRIPRNTGV